MPPARKSRRKPARPAATRRSSSSARPSFRVGALALAVPFIAFAIYVTYLFVMNEPDESEKVAPPAVSSNEASLAPLETTEVISALQRSGIASNRIVRSGKQVAIESVDTPAVVAERLAKQLPSGASVRVQGNAVEITRGNDRRLVRIEKLDIVDSGAGLVEAEEGEAIEPDAPDAPLPINNVSSNGGSKRIALILDDVGFANQPLTAAAALDPSISFAVIPNTPNAASAAAMLNGRGFELLCHLPMEPVGFPKVAPGQGAILTSMSDEEITRMTLSNIRSIPHISGVNNHMGSRATADPRVMREVLEAVRGENFFFVDSRTSARSVGAKLARELNVKTIARDVFLDDSMNEAAVRAQVRKLAEVAEQRGLAVGIGHVYPVTIRVLREEIPKLKARGFTFVRASTVVQ